MYKNNDNTTCIGEIDFNTSENVMHSRNNSTDVVKAFHVLLNSSIDPNNPAVYSKKGSTESGILGQNLLIHSTWGVDENLYIAFSNFIRCIKTPLYGSIELLDNNEIENDVKEEFELLDSYYVDSIPLDYEAGEEFYKRYKKLNRD